MVESGLHGLSQHHWGDVFGRLRPFSPTFAGFQDPDSKKKTQKKKTSSWKLEVGMFRFFFIKSGSFFGFFYCSKLLFDPPKYSWKITGRWPMGRKCKWATPCASGAKRRWQLMEWLRWFLGGGEWKARWWLNRVEVQPIWKMCVSN